MFAKLSRMLNFLVICVSILSLASCIDFSSNSNDASSSSGSSTTVSNALARNVPSLMNTVSKIEVDVSGFIKRNPGVDSYHISTDKGSSSFSSDSSPSDGKVSINGRPGSLVKLLAVKDGNVTDSETRRAK